MAVAAVAAAVYHAVLRILRDFEYPFFIFVKRPKMVFFVEAGLAAFGLVFLIFLITDIQKLPVVLRCHAGVLFTAGRAVAGESVHICARFHHRVDDIGHFADIGAGNGGHDHRTDARPVDAPDLFQRTVKRARLAEPVVCFPHAVQRKLVLPAAVSLQTHADLVGQVERIAQDGKRNVVLLQKCQQPPKVRVKDRVAAGDVKVRQPAVYLAEVHTVVKGFLNLLPGHGIQVLAVVFRENVAVFAPLVAFVRYVPLKGKIFFHLDCSVPLANSIAPAGAGYTFRNPAGTRPGKQGSYLSPAPQAEPQAAGFSSGLSPAPQAEPQAEAAASPFFCAQPNRLDSAMIVTSVFFI